MKNGKLQKEGPRPIDQPNFSGTVPASFEFIFPLLLILVTLIPYWQTASFGFVNFDDPSYVYENTLLNDGFTYRKMQEAIFRFHEANWHPLVWLSYMAEMELFGMKPGVMHVTNVVLHIANSLLFYVWLRRSTGDAVRSLLAGFIFALHPMHVESVAWITERKDVLSTLFLMATLIAYSEYIRRNSRGWYVAAILFFAVGLTAKAMLVTVPVVLLLLDFWPLPRFQLSAGYRVDRTLVRSIVTDKIPFVILSIAATVVTILAQHSAGAVAGITALPLHERIANSLVSFSRYVLKTLWPVHLSAYYPMPRGGWPGGVVIVSAVSLAAITWAAWRARNRQIAILIGWCWFAFTLLPVIGIIQVGSQSMADRYMYVPMAGLSLMLLWGLPDRWFRMRMKTVTLCGFSTLMLLVLATQQVSTWRDSITLFEQAILVAPDNNFTARINLGIAYCDAGRFRDADNQLSLALKLSPADAGCISNLARNCNRAGQYARTESLLSSAIQLHPDDAQLWLHLGNAMRGLGKPDSAIESYRKAIHLDPDFSEALNNLGLILCRTDNAEGMKFIRKALQADSKNAQAYNSLGNALVRAGDLNGAEQSYIEAIKLENLEESKQNLQYVRELTRETGRHE